MKLTDLEFLQTKTLGELMHSFDTVFDGIEDPDDYCIEFGRWITTKMLAAYALPEDWQVYGAL